MTRSRPHQSTSRNLRRHGWAIGLAGLAAVSLALPAGAGVGPDGPDDPVGPQPGEAAPVEVVGAFTTRYTPGLPRPGRPSR